MDSILSVRQVTEKVRQAVEVRFPYLWVQGEVTNLSRPSSGHVYFSLKEGDDLLNCVWFRNQQKDEAFDPLTGEVWEDGPRPSAARTMENGQTLICAGRLTVYGARGQYQMVVDFAKTGGLGLWHQEFEALKRRLAAEGLFDTARKRPIPHEPRKVAVVTAPSGAAVRDFIRIAGERGLGAEIRIYPTPVQGEEAPPRIAEALRQAGKDGWAQVIVLIRGGGSAQDLWAFNDERVARAVYTSPIPVLTGIGHEIDHSITDFTADLSAATPSHTAQLLWQERRAFEQLVDGLELSLTQAVKRRMADLTTLLEHRQRALGLLSPLERLRLQQEKLASSLRRMDTAMDARFSSSARTLERLSLRLANAGENRLQLARQEAERISAPLSTLGRMIGLKQEHDLTRLELRLQALDPFEPLARGYAMAMDEKGKFLRSVTQTKPGQRITVQMADGRILTVVDSVDHESPLSQPGGHDE
ncbi:MAG: exodeoxyribonuclease VII large subunit [Mailhella sp.]|nr:exodeoxyribonuclease VII large subunit [Mailhella sp.]